MGGFRTILLDPQSGDGGGSADDPFPAAPAVTTVSSAEAPPETSTDSSPSTESSTRSDPGRPTDPNLGAGGARPPAQPAQDQAQGGWRGVREVAQGLGYTFGEDVQDDATALMRLVEMANRANQPDIYAQVGRQIAPHIADILPVVQNRLKPAETVDPWARPPYDERWFGVLEQDPQSGVLIPKSPNVPPEIVTAANKYLDWAKRYQQDPQGYVTHYAKQVARETFNELFSQHQQESKTSTAIEGIMRQNASWLYARDGAGQLIPDPQTGDYRLTAQGTRWAEYVREAGRYGVKDPVGLNEYATAKLQSEIYRAMQQQQTAVQAQQNSPQFHQAQASPNRNGASTLPPTERRGNPAAVPPVIGTKRLSDLMREQAQLEGLTDADWNLAGQE